MGLVIAASGLREGDTIVKRDGKGRVRSTVKVQEVSRDCARGGTHINFGATCLDAMASVEVKR